jgi:adenine-specific DNA-methyltransferase
MSNSLRDLILTHVPEDGASVSNLALIARLRESFPGLTDEDYQAARDGLVDEGILGKGRGRGGSIFLVTESEDSEDQDDDFELAPTEESAPPQRRGTAKKKATLRRSGEPVQVLSYRHGETRVNNPEVGMVHAGTDPDGARTTWVYDPHLDPVLNFDSSRAGVEKLIDDALASDDPQAMKDALTELKRLQAPYLNWTGKAERTSFEIDTVSLHVHERVPPSSSGR